MEGMTDWMAGDDAPGQEGSGEEETGQETPRHGGHENMMGQST